MDRGVLEWIDEKVKKRVFEPQPRLRVRRKTADEKGVSPAAQILVYNMFIYLMLKLNT